MAIGLTFEITPLTKRGHYEMQVGPKSIKNRNTVARGYSSGRETSPRSSSGPIHTNQSEREKGGREREMSSSSPHRSRGGGDNGTSSKSKGEDRPRFFDSKAKSNCWAKADVVPGRHPERWRKDAAGNVVCKRFCNCQGCLCFEYDHIVPFSKGGESTEDNCQILQTRVNRFKSDKDQIDKTQLKGYSCDVKFTANEDQTCGQRLSLTMVAFGTQPTDSSIRATSFSCGKPTIDVYSPTSKIYTTSTPPKAYKRSTIPQNGDKELDIIEMAVYGDVIRPGNQCRCRTVAEMLGQYQSKDKTAACKLP